MTPLGHEGSTPSSSRSFPSSTSPRTIRTSSGSAIWRFMVGDGPGRVRRGLRAGGARCSRRRGPAALPAVRGAARGGLVLRLPQGRGEGLAERGRRTRRTRSWCPPAWLLLVALLVWLVRRRATAARGHGAVSHADGRAAGRLVRRPDRPAWLRGRGHRRGAPLARRAGRGRSRGRPSRPRPRRDIYLIVLDEYANSDVLRERLRVRQPPLRGQPPRARLPRPRAGAEQLSPHAAVAALDAQLGAPRPAWSASWAPTTRHPALPNYLLEHSRVAPLPRGAGLPVRLLPLALVVLDQRQRRGRRRVPAVDTGSTSCGRCRQRRAAADGARARRVLRYFDRIHHWEAEHVRRTLDGPGRPWLAHDGSRPVRLRPHPEAARPLRVRPRVRDAAARQGGGRRRRPTSSSWSA